MQKRREEERLPTNGMNERHTNETRSNGNQLFIYDAKRKFPEDHENDGG